MDAFKSVEIERMRLGGNDGWRKFYETHEDTDKTGGVSWDAGTDADRYTSDVGEEWKERLTCKVEGREYVPGEKKKPASSSTGKRQSPAPRSGTPLSGSRGEGGGAGQPQPGGKAKVDDQYFAKLGADNASRPDNLPPSQGGKYAGFGNTPGPASQSSNTGISFDDVQKDPVAALTKGFGWFTTTVTKTAKTVNDGYIQPTAKQVR
jgi:ADP-ribosylation factor GTPase-activating protein 1